MALTKLVDGVQREVWSSDAQNGGASQTVSTGIRINASQLCRVQGILAVGTPTGSPVFTATLSIISGLLVVTVANTAAGGNLAPWQLDVRLVQSPDQVNRGASGYIMVANGATSGLAAPQTLAATYAIGGSSANQTMVLSTANGDGIIVDGVTQAGAAGLYAFEVRESTNYPTTAITRRGDDITGPVLELNKARGSFGAPADTQTTDQLGTLSFYGYAGGAVEGARIESEAIMAGGALGGLLDFYTKLSTGAIARSLRVTTVAGPTHRLILTDPGQIVSEVWPNTSTIGFFSLPWSAGYFTNLLVALGSSPNDIGGGAIGTLVFTNTSTMPVPQANQVYLGSEDFGAGAGTNLAVISISCEEPVVPAPSGVDITDMVPVRINSVPYYLLAVAIPPA